MLVAESADYLIEFPKEVSNDLSQDEEYCFVIDKESGQKEKINFHDYGRIYSIPGLYEFLFYEKLECCSPTKICGLLNENLKKLNFSKKNLKVLDLGAGNGMVGEEFYNLGVTSITGIDLLTEAQEAAMRDRPGVYKDYYSYDLTQLSDKVRQEFKNDGFNCLTCVAAFGFSDIPPLVFAETFNFIKNSGYVAFNIKEDFISNCDQTGFMKLIHNMIDGGILKISDQIRYRHRYSLRGDPLYYIAMVGRKKKDIPNSWGVFQKEKFLTSENVC